MLVPAKGDAVLSGPSLQADGVHEHVVISIGIRVMLGEVIVSVLPVDKAIAGENFVAAIDGAHGEEEQECSFISHVAVSFIADGIVAFIGVAIHQRPSLAGNVPAIHQIVQGKLFFAPGELGFSCIIRLVILVHNQALAAAAAVLRIGLQELPLLLHF